MLRIVPRLFRVLQNRELYLPSFNSTCMTDEYLDHLLKGNIFHIKRSAIKLAVILDDS